MYILNGGRQLKAELMEFGRPAKSGQIRAGMDRMLLHPFSPDKVISIKSCGDSTVHALQTTTGNYIVWGLGSSNSFQMMNDPSPSGEKPWLPVECEHTCTLEEAKGAGHVVVLSDPAPFAMGSVDGRDERYRRDGTKNWWATVVVKMRVKGQLRQMILLDGIQSKSWGLEEGMKQAVKLALKWRAVEGYCESTSTPIYLEKFIEAKKELGWKGFIIGSRKRIDAEDRLKATYNSRAKINYLLALADRAKAQEVIVCDTFPLKEEFFAQMRGFMPLPDGRTGIPFDDLVNAVSFGTDPYFKNRYQAVEEEWSWSPFRSDTQDESFHGTKHVHW
jgi:hypothetical protein